MKNITSRHCLWGMILSPIFALFPLGVTFGAVFLSNILGCHLDEGSVHSCTLFSLDIGGFLYGAGLFFFYSFITLPLGGIFFIVFLLLYIVLKFKFKR